MKHGLVIIRFILYGIVLGTVCGGMAGFVLSLMFGAAVDISLCMFGAGIGLGIGAVFGIANGFALGIVTLLLYERVQSNAYSVYLVVTSIIVSEVVLAALQVISGWQVFWSQEDVQYNILPHGIILVIAIVASLRVAEWQAEFHTRVGYLVEFGDIRQLWRSDPPESDAP